MIGKTLSVLVVDDEHVERELFRQALEGASYAVWTAGSYAAAIRIFHEHKDECDLLVVDVSLPDKNGVELVMELSAAKPELKYIFVSGWVGAEVLGSCGVSVAERCFLQKPFTLPMLVDRVGEILKSDKPSPLRNKAGDQRAAANGE